MKGSKKATANGIGLLLARVPMGVFFLVLGYWKFHGGVNNFIQGHISQVPSMVPHDWGYRYLQAVPYAEMAVGALLILGLLTRIAGGVGAAMIISFTIAATGWKQEGLPFNPNLIFIGLLLAILLVGPGKMSLDHLFFYEKPKPAPEQK